ncbi:probable vacuolar protein sorting-associated protein 37A at C-terminar half [Coccomyxa sp. Obi]|nr:probable vacuolar protein sorting-associated protein 37A at C-terminar half [Coccomyxa sp. Obi]
MYSTQERQKQTSELLTEVPGCRPLNRDQSLYEVPVRMRDGRITNLRITLPANFPQGRPALSVTHPIRHPWVDSAGRLSFPALDGWAPGRSRLAAVVAEASTNLSGHPARTDASPSPQRPSTGSPSVVARPPVSPSRAPTVPNEFPELATISMDELTELLCDEAKYTAFVQKQAAKTHIAQVKAQLRSGNLELARQNLEKESTLAELRNQIAIIRSSEYAAVKESFDEQYKRQQAVIQPLQPAALIAALERAASNADKDSDQVYDDFLKGQKSVDVFVQEYVKARSLFHQRELKKQAAQQTL